MPPGTTAVSYTHLDVYKRQIQEIASKSTVTTNDTKTYDNGVKVVPTMLLDPVSCDKSNIKKVLLDAKYYTEAQIGS